jgi:hypothetical protein
MEQCASGWRGEGVGQEIDVPEKTTAEDLMSVRGAELEERLVVCERSEKGSAGVAGDTART